MSKKIKQQIMKRKPEYKVSGRIGYWDDSSHDSDAVFRGAMLNKKIEAANDEEAVVQARELISAFIEENTELYPDNNESLDESPCYTRQLLFQLVRTDVLLEIEWDKGQAAKPAVPAVKEIKSHVVERKVAT